jgi:low affinity Fe/Cu permease
MRQRGKPDIFNRFTTCASTVLGRAWVFVGALLVLLLWGATGPLLGFSDTWQLIINTSTTIITFLMVFVIQNTQNRDNMATNIKLDAIMKRVGVSNKNYLEAEDESDKQLEHDKKVVQRSKRRARRR